MDTMFYGKHRRPSLVEGVMDQVSMVETAGYITAEQQINMFIQAGRRLQIARKEQFDFVPGAEVPDDVVVDPTRSGSFDLSDATQLGRATLASLSAQVAEGRKSSEAKAKKDESEPPNGSSQVVE